jgi:hypothetical protein
LLLTDHACSAATSMCDKAAAANIHVGAVPYAVLRRQMLTDAQVLFSAQLVEQLLLLQ